MIEGYYKRPILYDYIISIIIIGLIIILEKYSRVSFSGVGNISEFASDIGGVGLTISGFILTLITILMTLKSGQIISEEELKNSSSPFKIFLDSQLYIRSIDILKNGVLSLIFACFVIYLYKLFAFGFFPKYLFYLNIVGLIIIITTFLRCFYVLNLIMRMQKTKKEIE